MIIYLDVLVIINIYADYFLLKATERLCHEKCSRLRIITASLVGGVFSLLILAPPLNFFLELAIKIFISLILTLICFGFVNLQTYFKRTAVFFGMIIVFSGVEALIYTLISPLEMHYNNGFAYINISSAIIIFSTIIAYLIIKVAQYIMYPEVFVGKTYTITITNNDIDISSSAIADSGNSLIDFFSGLPVIVCSYDICRDISPPSLPAIMDAKVDYSYADISVQGVKIIPYSTVGNSGIMFAFKPQKIVISDGNVEKNVRAIIGIAPQKIENNDVIFNPKLLN